MRAALLFATLCLVAACKDEAKQEVDRGELESRWAAFSRCVIGTTPLEEDESAASRMRKAELTLLASAAESKWPGTCIERAEKVLELLDGPGGDAYAEMRSQLRLLAGSQPDMFLSGGEEAVVSQLWELAEKSELEPLGEDVKVEGPSAPEPSKPASSDLWVELGESGGTIERVELAPSARAIRFAFGDEEAGAFSCLLSGEEGAPLTSARCAAVPGERSALFRPLSAESPEAHYVWDFQPKPTVIPLGGEPIEMPSSASAFVFSDGVVVDVLEGGVRPILARRLASGRIDRAPLRPPPGGHFLGYRAGALLWKGAKRGHGVSPLRAQSALPGRIPLTGDREVGEVQPSVEHLIACRHGEVLTVAIIGDDAKDGVYPVEVLRREGKGFSRPIETQVDLGADVKLDQDNWRSMSCDATGATLTFLRADQRVGQLVCAEEACTSSLSEPISSVGKIGGQRVARLGGSVLLVRVVNLLAPMTGVTDMVLMRLAPLSELAAAPDQVLIGDEEHGGLEGLSKGLGLVSTGTAAAVLVRSHKNVHGIRVTEDGTFGGLSAAK